MRNLIVCISLLATACADAPTETQSDPEAVSVTTVVHLRPDGHHEVEYVYRGADSWRPIIERMGVAARQQGINETPCQAPSWAPVPLILYDAVNFAPTSGQVCFFGEGTAVLADFNRIHCAAGQCALVGTWDSATRSYQSSSITGAFRNAARGTSAIQASMPVADAVTQSSTRLSVTHLGFDGGTGGCLPNTAATACGTQRCGTAEDGCGGIISCDSLCLSQGPNAYCDASNTCVCTPSVVTCDACPRTQVADGCGGRVTCGNNCLSGQHCCGYACLAKGQLCE